jgi:hypothetical protein
MLDRFKTMSPGEQKQFIDRMKARGDDAAEFEKLVAAAAPKKPQANAKYGTVSGETIDALFGPLPPVESTGRVWLYVDKQLKPARVRLGITDGTYTELLDQELSPGMQVVTGMILPSNSRTAATNAGRGNPLMPGGGRGPGGFGGGGRGR